MIWVTQIVSKYPKKIMLKVENLNEHIFEIILWECSKHILRFNWLMWIISDDYKETHCIWIIQGLDIL